jgi:hypothetical protein
MGFTGDFKHDKNEVKKTVAAALKKIKKAKDFEDLTWELNDLFEFTNESADHFVKYV